MTGEAAWSRLAYRAELGCQQTAMGLGIRVESGTPWKEVKLPP